MRIIFQVEREFFLFLGGGYGCSCPFYIFLYNKQNALKSFSDGE
jgi:hypothetical protein